MQPADRDIVIGHGVFSGHRHVCAFFTSLEEEQRVLEPFIREGLELGEKVLLILDPEKRTDYLMWLRTSGILVDETLASGQLEAPPWDEVYVRKRQFDQRAMLSWVDSALRETAAHYPRTRVVAHMEWALLDLPGVEDLLEYEARVNHVLRHHDAPVICAYDASRFGADVAMDVVRTHPMVIIGGVLQENPFFIPPDELLAEIRDARSRRLPERPAHSPTASAI